MNICQEYHEQESLTVLFVAKSFVLSKTTRHKKPQGIRSIVVRTVGQFVEQFITFANTVGIRLEHRKLSISNIAIRSVGIKGMLEYHTRPLISRTSAEVLKAKSQRTLGNLENYILCGIQTEQTRGSVKPTSISSGGLQLSRGMDTFVKYVATKGQVARSLMLTTLSRLVYTQNYVLRLVTAEYCADPVMLRPTHGARRSPKRYHKFINNGNEEGWEDGTPAINN